jgi:hypothetical protein
MGVKSAILFNGPPRAGKDTASEALIAALPHTSRIMKFTEPVKNLTHRQFGLAVRHDHFEPVKDTPLAEFGGLTPREAYIQTSTKLKAEYGFDVVARLFVETMDQAEEEIIINPDLGYDYEGLAVVERLGAERVLLVHVEREGHTFDNDCRNWVHLSGVKTIKLRNDDRATYLDEVVAEVSGFLMEQDYTVEFGKINAR